MIIVELPPGRDAERHYVLEQVLGDWLGLEWNAVPGDPGRVRIRVGGEHGHLDLPDLFFATPHAEWGAASSLPALPLRRAEVATILDARLVDQSLPILYGAEQAAALPSDAGTSTGIDLFGSIFVLLTRYDELSTTERDRHGRLPAAASLPGRGGFLDRPLADEYAELLWALLRRQWPRLQRRPRRRQLHVTHDVDFGRFSQTARWPVAMRSAVADLVKRREPALMARRLASFAARRLGVELRGDPYDTFDRLMATSERHGLRGAFYFVTERPGPIEATYDIGDAWVRTTLRRIARRGHEVGLHASYGSHQLDGQVGREFERLRELAAAAGVAQEAWGGRQHYLRWHTPGTWRAWDEAGLDYDSTLAFADAPGFRAGTAREFAAFDLEQRRPLRIRERPLIAMDATFFHYVDADLADMGVQITELARRARLVEGDFVLLWHNSNLVGRRREAFYDELVAELVRIVG